MNPLNNLDRILDFLPDWLELIVLTVVVILLLWQPFIRVIETLSPVVRQQRETKAKAEAVVLELATKSLAKSLAGSDGETALRSTIEENIDQAAAARLPPSGLNLTLSACLGGAIFCILAVFAASSVGALTNRDGTTDVNASIGLAIICAVFVASGFVLNFNFMKTLGFLSRTAITFTALFFTAYLVIGLKSMF